MKRIRAMGILCAMAAGVGFARSTPAGASEDVLECLIRPRSSAKLSVPGEGIIDRIHVDRGDLVEEGQALVELESSVEQASVEIARARSEMDAEVLRGRVRLDFAKRTRKRDEELMATAVISEKDLDESRSSLELARAGLRAAEQQKRLADLELQRAIALLELRTIRSPMRGVVVERWMAPGEYADAEPILEVADIDPLYVDVIAPVSLFGRVQVGARAKVRPEEPVGGVYEAQVTVVDRVIEAASGTFRIRLELANPEYRIPAGLGCRVELPGSEAPQAAATAP